MSASEPFSASKAKLQRAARHLDTLDQAIAEYFSTNWYKCTFEPDESGQMQFSTIIFGEPTDFSVIVGDAIHNMRAALDLLAVDIVRVSGGDTKGVYFPFCSEEALLEETMKSRNLHRAQTRFQDMIRALKPYKGGNASLRALHDLDIQDKHHALIPNVASISSPPIGVALDANGAPIGFAEGQLQLVADLTVAPKVKFTFPNGSALSGDSVASGLRALLALVSQIVESFQVEAAR